MSEKTHYETILEELPLVYAYSKPAEVFLLLNVMKRELQVLKKKVEDLEGLRPDA